MKFEQMHPRMLDLLELLEGVEAGAVVLPDFQRDFDWSDSDVKALLVTVLSSWPAGSFLLMEGEPTFFEVRALEGAPPKREPVELVILDGQQRVTGLFQALFDAGEYVYAIDLSLLGEGSVDNLEESVVSFKRSEWDQRLRSPGSQLSGNLVPAYALRSPTDFFGWRDEVAKAAPINSRDAVSGRLTEIYREHLAGVHKYGFPAVTVRRSIEPAAIARIFERVNRTGMRLSAFDLVVARSYEPDWNLRDHWEEARRNSVLIDRFLGSDGMPVLQSMALRYFRNVRQSAVLNMPGNLVREQWDTTVEDIEKALRFITETCGGIEPDWIPYRVMIVVLGGLAREDELMNNMAVKRWFWATGFSGAYDAASNTRAVADYIALAEQAEFSPRPIIAPVLTEATRRRQRALWRSFMCALLANGARDLLTDEVLMRNEGGGRELRSDVIVQPLLHRWQAESDTRIVPPHVRVLNMSLLTRGSANRLRNRGLLALRQTSLEDDLSHRDETLISQFLPPLGDLPSEDAWQTLIEARLERLAEFLHSHNLEVVREREWNGPTDPDIGR